MMRLGILGSTRGTHLQTIIEAMANQTLSASIAVVVSNKAEAGILARANAAQLNAQFLNAEGMGRAAFDAKTSQVLCEYAVDLVVLVGYMRILSKEFVKEWEGKIINVHPSLLPAFSGLMDMAVHEAVIASGVKETGCTVHCVTEAVDAGPIILQRKCEVLSTDTPQILKQRVQALEGKALVDAIKLLSASA